jgi:hypothetical protein
MTNPQAQARIDATRRNLNLIQELDIAIEWLGSGLAILQQSRLFRPRRFTILLLFANGLERLMKVILSLHAFETRGMYLSQQELKSLGHKLTYLRDRVVRLCFTPTYLQRPIAQEDLNFLQHDETCQTLLNILSEFATYKRYAYLDGTNDPNAAFDAPDRLWGELEMKLLSTDEIALLLNVETEDVAQQLAVERLSTIIEKSLRALTRLFTLAELGPQARQISPAVSHFARLRDDQIGQQTYDL